MRIARICLVFALGMPACFFAGCAGKPPAPPSAPDALPVEVAAAESAEMTREISLTGAIRPREEASISVSLSARVMAVRVKEGDKVSAGQVILELDPTTARARLQQAEGALSAARSQYAGAEAAYAVEKVTAPSQYEQAQAALSSAKATLAKAELDLQRAEELYRQGAAAKEQVDSARTYREAAAAAVRQAQAGVDAAKAGLRQVEIKQLAQDSARAAVEQAKGAVTSAREDLGNTILRAPISGVVYWKDVRVGDVPVSMGSPLIRIAALEQVYFEATVPEKDLSSLSTGQQVAVTVDALTGQSFRGRVERLVPVATGQSRDFLARIAVDNTNLRLRPGMFARGNVLVERHASATVVPTEAVLGDPGKQMVYVVKGNRTESRKVTTGIQNATVVEILAGVAPGEDIVISGQQGLKSGQTVNVIRRR